ncbi:hypothetical protein ACLESD_02710 [Pyxidicoccus sp. 3LFB2]
MTAPLRSLKLSLAAALSLAAFVPAGAAGSTPSVSTTPARTQELARVTGERGSYVAWLENAEGGVDLAISVALPGRPLVAAEFVEKHSPAEVFLAVAPRHEQLPPALARREEAMLAYDGEKRLRLQRENQEALARMPLADVTASSSLAAGCTDAFRQAVGLTYGDLTCGQAGLAVIDDTYTSDTYCTSGCDFPLGEADRGTCSPAIRSCDIVEGSASIRRLRTTTRGSPVMTHKGHRAHFGVANCSGDGPVVFKRQRGDNVASYEVAVGHMLHFYQGTGSLAPSSAKSFVSYGQWNRGTPPSGSTYVDNLITVENNSGVDDRVIACGDIFKRYDMYDISSPSCHGAEVSLCTSASCDTACFNCSGGTCN